MTTPTTAASTEGTSTQRSSRARDLGRFALRHQGWLILLILLALAALASPQRDGTIVFLQPANLLNIVRFASVNGIIAIGMTMVILIGGIDLSVGAVMALGAVVAAKGLMQLGLDTIPAVALTLAVTGTIGLVNGWVTTRFNLQSFITTLAMLSVARGIASLLAGGYAIPLAFGDRTDAAPASFKALFGGTVEILGLDAPISMFYFIGVGIIATLLLNQTGFGRHVYAIGGNKTAARLSGVNVKRVTIIVFAICSLLAGLAALLHAALVSQGSHVDGGGYELNAIAAVVIGGTLLSGGVGTIVGTMIGAVILSILDNILGLNNISSEFQLILKGVIIVLAVAIQRQQGSNRSE
jgi:ribose transport system permease protein